MKAHILGIDGKKMKDIELSDIFSQPVREDIVSRVLEAKKTKQPYSPSLVAGKQHSASGILRHRRHVWKSSRGRGISRIPRKIFSRKGSQFRWEGAEIASARGGRRAHPPKILSMIAKRKMNKKEAKMAFVSAISATANPKKVSGKYKNLKEKKLNLPLIVESEFLKLKTKNLLESLKKILGEETLKAIIKKRKIRAGKGKMRGRKYKKSSGMLLVTGKNEKIKTNVIDMKNVGNLSINDLASGGLGRLVIYTENAIKELNDKFGRGK